MVHKDNVNGPFVSFITLEVTRSRLDDSLRAIDYSHENAPHPNEWIRQHLNDIEYHQVPPGYNLKPEAEGLEVYQSDDNNEIPLADEINQPGVVIHPAVEPMAPRPAEMSHGLADYDEAPPDPMPPQPPYLNPPSKPDQFDYHIPPAYRAYYPTNAPSEGSMTQPDECVPIGKLSVMRESLPKDLAESDYCIPSKFVPAGYEGTLPDASTMSSPQFSLPETYSEGPMFPPLHPLGDMNIPMAPLPGPSSGSRFDEYGARVPIVPMVPLPPAMYPY